MYRLRLLLLFTFTWLGWSLCMADVWGGRHFLRVDTTLPVRVAEPPTFSVSGFDKVPPVSNFLPLTGTDEGVHIPWPAKVKDCWFRWTLENNSSSVQVLALRINRGNNRIRLYRMDDSVAVEYHATSALTQSAIGTSFYAAIAFELPPGRHTFALAVGQVYYKNIFEHLDVVSPKELADDRVEFLVANSTFVFALFTFNALIVFQLLYILIQWIYHRRREYLQYLLYLVCIELYFGIRYELVYNIPILTGLLPGVNQYMSEVLLFLPYFFYLRFTRYYINMPELYPQVNKYVIRLEYLILLYIIPVFLFAILGFQKLSTEVSLIFLTLIYLCTLWLIRFFYTRRDKLIRFVLVGSVFAATGHLLAMLSTYFWTKEVEPLFPPIYFTMTGIIFEIFFFNTGLGYKAMAEQDEKLQVQAEMIHQLEEKRKVQEQLLHMRNRIAADLHDDVGSTLGSIVIFSEVADKTIDTDPEKVKSILARIRKSSVRIMEAMRDIVWATHTSDHEQTGLSLKLREAAHGLLQDTPISFTFEEAGDPGSIQFLPEVKRNLLMVFREAVNNAVKHSQCTAIFGTLSIRDNTLQLIIRDNGAGFDSTKVSGGIGMHNMLQRVEQVGGTIRFLVPAGGGTEIIIKVPL